MIKVKNIKDLTSMKKGLNALKLFSDESLEVIHITLSEGEIIKEHKNSVDVVFYVLEGKGELIVEGEKYHIEKGSCLEVKRDLIRSWENVSVLPLCLMAIKKMK